MKVRKLNILAGLACGLLSVSAFAQTSAEPASQLPFPATVVKPVRPYEFASREAEATVLFRLNRSGRPFDIEVESASDPTIADSVKSAVLKWRFEGVESDPKWTEVRYRLPVLFTDGATSSN